MISKDNENAQQSEYKYTKNDLNSDSDVNYSDHQSKEKI